MTKKLHIAMLHNFNLQFAEQPVEKTDILVTEGIIPLLNLYDAHPEVKADYFFTGYTDEYLLNQHPDIVERIKLMRESRQIAIGTYTYSHPVLTLIPYEDVSRQLARGLEIDEKTWGERPTGLLLPEVSWDVTLPQIMPQLGIEWVIVYEALVPQYAGKNSFPGTVKLQGINEKTTTGILAHDKMRDPIWSIAESGEGLNEYLKQIDAFYTRTEGDQLLALKTDAEFLYFSGIARLGLSEGDSLPGEPPGLVDMNQLYSALSQLDYVEFTTIPEWIDQHPPTETVYAESKGGNDALDRWLRGFGRERLNLLEADAREQIRMADGVLTLAEVQGMDTTEARLVYERAWDQLLLAENSDGRGFDPHSSRKIFVAQSAVNAVELARQAIQLIEHT